MNKYLYLLTLIPFFAHARPTLQIESGASFQTRNEARIPGSTGTLVDLTKFGKGPAIPLRAELSYGFGNNKKHVVRGLWAPFKLTSSGQKLSSATNFAGQSFNTTDDVSSLYKFNSYRLSYVYRFEQRSNWNFGLGFTGKIRDAEIRLTQNSVSGSKKNVGFVPLIRFEATRVFNEFWALHVDADGLAAPQGRALDLGIMLERSLTTFGAGHRASLIAGYRTVEGGADNDVVYNFAWLHTATLGVRAAF
jgi:hypothetical protein